MSGCPGDVPRDLLVPLWRLMGIVRRTSGLEAPLTIDSEGWLQGRHVKHVASHETWYYAHRPLETMTPAAIVVHTTETDWGTARVMARRRTKPASKRPSWMGLSSWHVTVAHDGLLWQQVPLLRGAWHAGSPTARPVPGLGIKANVCSVGIELEGHGDRYPEAQLLAACRLWPVLCETYEIPRKRAMVPHSVLDSVRRNDPGLLFMRCHAPRVLAPLRG